MVEVAGAKMTKSISKAFGKVKESTSRMVTKSRSSSSLEEPTPSAYMANDADDSYGYRESKVDKLTGTLSKGISSGKYAVYRSFKSVKFEAQEQKDKLSTMFSRKQKHDDFPVPSV